MGGVTGLLVSRNGWEWSGQQLQPTELFKHPFVVGLVDAGFDKPADARYFAPPVPQAMKTHQDCTFKGYD
jgi:hypothetical protein